MMLATMVAVRCARGLFVTDPSDGFEKRFHKAVRRLLHQMEAGIMVFYLDDARNLQAGAFVLILILQLVGRAVAKLARHVGPRDRMRHGMKRVDGGRTRA